MSKPVDEKHEEFTFTERGKVWVDEVFKKIFDPIIYREEKPAVVAARKKKYRRWAK